jgi:hypothetical protein
MERTDPGRPDAFDLTTSEQTLGRNDDQAPRTAGALRPPLPAPLHPHLLVVDQPGAVARRIAAALPGARRVLLLARRAYERAQELDQDLERRRRPFKWTKTAGEVAKCPASCGTVHVACPTDQKVRATYPTLSMTRTCVRTLMLHGKMPAPRCWGRDAGILPVELRLRQRVVVSQHEAASAHPSEQRLVVGPQVRADLRHRGPQRGI